MSAAGEGMARVRAVFEELCELPAAERARRLAGLEDGVRTQVESLLASHDAAGAFLSTPAAEMEARGARGGWDEGEDPFIGFTLAGYRITGVLGSGGMGSVYSAEQTSPRRTVALKVIRAGWNTPTLRRRFAHEAEALGRLRHPGIAQIFEAGAAAGPDGREIPFFAMELVSGEPVTRFAGARGLGVREKLALMALVCDAAHHAHQKGIVHRDLKPANILVEEAPESATRVDAGTTTHTPSAWQPKILDFGIARLTAEGGEGVDGVTQLTDAGALVGTLAYMSPEQVRGRVDEIDTRSDVYALGVVLFEVLTGRLPYAVSGKGLPEAARVIAEDEPTLPGSVERSLRGDLETIILKAIAKEPERRYQSAAELAADLRRYLGDLPIVARPATTAYQLRKFARRNRALVAGVCAAFVALAAGMAGTTWGMVRAKEAESLAKQRELSAASEARKARKSVDFLVTMLTSADPDKTAGRDVTVREVLDQAAAGTKELQSEPEVLLAAQSAIGRTYRAIGVPEKAELHLAEAVAHSAAIYGERSREHATVLHEMALAYVELKQWPRIVEYGRRALEIYESEATPEALVMSRILATIGGAQTAMNDIVEAEKSANRAYELAKGAGGNQDAAAAAGLLADIKQRVGGKTASAEAERYLREQLALLTSLRGETHSQTADAAENLGWFLANERRPKEALPLLEQSERTHRALYGEQHRKRFNALTLMARCHQDLGQLEKAEEVATVAVNGLRVAAPDGPDLALATTRLGRCRYLRKDYAGAEDCYRESLRINIKNKDPRVVVSMSSLAGALEFQGKFDEALELQQAAIARRRAATNPGSDFGTLLSNLAALLSKMERYEEAEAMFKESIGHDAKVRPGHPLNGLNLRVYANFLVARGRAAEAVPRAREAWDLCRNQSAGERRGIGVVLLKALEESGQAADADVIRKELEALTPPGEAKPAG